LTMRNFHKIANLTYDTAGVKMHVKKHIMVESRLKKRLNALQIHSFTDYIKYVKSGHGVQHEHEHFIHALTTHKTDFFREPNHFDFLTNHAIPLLQKAGTVSAQRPLKVWSAACSQGDEPYTIAIVLSEFKERTNRPFDFTIVASDISKPVVDFARKAIYSESSIEPIAVSLRRKYLLRSKDPTKKMYRIHPAVRKKVSFFTQNLTDENLSVDKALDIVFLRNVMIYFSEEDQHTIINHICNHIRRGGFLFMGHSEVLNTKEYPLKAIAPTVYQVV
ncbi:MAG: hypothetical protein OCC49_18880, partial [Fibrobacterales bacterium]